MASTCDGPVEVRCSFCARTEREVRKIIAGPGIYICDGCVGRCEGILAEDRRSDRPQLPAWESMSDDELLAHLPRVAAVGEQVEANLRQWVLRARDRGIAWARIGAAMGMTRQSAWGRFSGEE
ncbi:Clp protease ClpX [Luteipulveratus mongoliensis]|uniref:Clp protease ClpX n=2 Tax=Luteipulveratus mongoliensis TaxID=571913 RepID=A0A0K1JJS6_9MICO|nr:Clp protease ClpX [Luteipulveratus mongoliensis]